MDGSNVHVTTCCSTPSIAMGDLCKVKKMPKIETGKSSRHAHPIQFFFMNPITNMDGMLES